MKVNRVMGWGIVLVGFFYGMSTTMLYGRHWLPSCDAEVVADGFFLVICSIGFAVLSFRNKE
jgi:hypothetical protein